MRSGLFAALADRVRRFRRSESGNVAMMFALASVPLIVSVGGLLDYTRSTMARSAMQDALDATSLALARQPNVATMSDDAMKTFATNYFNANYTDVDAKSLDLTPTYNPNGPSVTVDRIGLDRHELPRAGGHQLHTDRRLFNHGMGPGAASRRARPRQYRLHGRRREDDRTEGGHAQPLDPAEERRKQRRRRLRLDHPVQQGRQRRHEQLSPRTGSAGTSGRKINGSCSRSWYTTKSELRRRTARPGRRTVTRPGTAALPTATRTMTRPMTPRTPAPRQPCSRRRNTATARER